MTAPVIKGWCPGALRPMMSEDGFIVRVKPVMGQLTNTQIYGLCAISQKFGTGFLDLTSRANIQLRGIEKNTYSTVINALSDLHLIDQTPEIESKRNILIAPEWMADDKTVQLHSALLDNILNWPTLPNKMGIAIDLGSRPCLQNCSADFRFEMSDTTMILRGDGAATGVVVTRATAPQILQDMMEWFVTSGGIAKGRMARHLSTTPLPDIFQGKAPKQASIQLPLGATPHGIHLGAAFGQIMAADLIQLMNDTQGATLRVTPWRSFIIKGATSIPPHDFIQSSDDPRLRVMACAGQPGCTQALQITRDIAATLAKSLPLDKTAHISGCTKGCAHPKQSDVTIVGTQSGYDLVRNGTAWDTPAETGLTPQDILKELAR